MDELKMERHKSYLKICILNVSVSANILEIEDRIL